MTKKPRIKIAHLLLDPGCPEDIPMDRWSSAMSKQQQSINAFRAISTGFACYSQHYNLVNRTELPAESCAQPSIINHSKDFINNPPVLSYGHYGAYRAHRAAINDFGDYDALLVVESDATYDITSSEMTEAIYDAYRFALERQGAMVTFGEVKYGEGSRASVSDTAIHYEHYKQIDHFLDAHCYLVLRSERERIQRKLQTTGWHAWDIWLYWNYDARVKIYAPRSPIVRQLDGVSMIDYNDKQPGGPAPDLKHPIEGPDELGLALREGQGQSLDPRGMQAKTMGVQTALSTTETNKDRKIIKQNNNMKYTQYEEEGVILEYFKDSDPGQLAFLDIGANDGVSYSNSRRIAIDGWKGVCLEPSPSAYNKLLAIYADSDRVYPVNYGISDVAGEFEFHESGNWEGRDYETPVSILGTLDPEQKKRFDGMTWSVIRCNFVTFHEFLNDSPIQKFDFISIDVEGHDWMVLRQIDLRSLGCQMICMEHNSENYRLGLYEGYCQAYGMTEIYRSKDNVIYAVKS